MLLDYFSNHLIVPMILAVVLITLSMFVGAINYRLYRRKVSKNIQYKDEKALDPLRSRKNRKKIRVQMLVGIIVGLLLSFLVVMAELSDRAYLQYTEPVAGLLFLTTFYLITLNIRNYFHFKITTSKNIISGKISISKGTMFKNSLADMAIFILTLIVMLALTGRTFFVGGIIGVALLSLSAVFELNNTSSTEKSK